jgi:hypothetical protein
MKRGSKPAIGEQRMTDPNPFTAFDYLDYADQFYDAFHELPPRHPALSWPRYFLLCHSIELALKAYLAKLGSTPKQLRDFDIRHDFDKLVTEAVQKSLHLTSKTQEEINLPKPTLTIGTAIQGTMGGSKFS